MNLEEANLIYLQNCNAANKRGHLIANLVNTVLLLVQLMQAAVLYKIWGMLP